MTNTSGFLFFGTISHVEDAIRGIVEGPSWHANPVQFLVLDLSLVAGVDMSSAEAFVRIHRFLSAKSVTLVFCGFSAESTVGKALESVHVLGADGVELFSTFSDAMECEWKRNSSTPKVDTELGPLGTENVYLRTWFMSQKHESTSPTLSKLYIRRFDKFIYLIIFNIFQALPGRQAENGYQVILSPLRTSFHDSETRDVVNGWFFSISLFFFFFGWHESFILRAVFYLPVFSRFSGTA